MAQTPPARRDAAQRGLCSAGVSVYPGNMASGRQDEIRRVADHDRDHWRAEMERRVRHAAELKGVSEEGRAERYAAELAKVEDRETGYNYWLANYGWMSNPKADIREYREMPFVPWPKQLELAKWYDDRMRRQEVGIVPKSREVGVTWWFLHRFLWCFLFESGFSALLGSRKENLVDKKGDSGSLFERLRYILAKQPAHILTPRLVDGITKTPDKWIRDNKLMLQNLSNGALLVGEATNPDFGRGKRYTVAMIDEYAAVKAPIAAATWRALDSVSRSVFAVWNPASKGHITYDLHRGKLALNKDQIFEINWRADPRRSEQFREDRIRPRGALSPEDFEQEYECKYGTVNREGLIYDAVRAEVAYNKEDLPEHLELRAPLFGCWDFGSGPSLLCCILALYDTDTDTLWIEHSLTWSQTKWRVAAADALEVMRRYERRDYHFGDPAGIQRDSDQSSWQANLRAGGVPLFCLPAWANQSSEHEWGFKLIQERIDTGRLRISREARYLWQCLDNWQRNIPEGMSADYISREYLAPRGDIYGHGGMALCYFGIAIDKMMHKRSAPRLTKAVRLSNTLNRTRGDGSSPMAASATLASAARRENTKRVLKMAVDHEGAYELPPGHPELKRKRKPRSAIGALTRAAMGIRGY